ncbi:TetR/AcrR family transcriptional regulator [Baekduia soli]|uniref:TetR/AcrR family transcriptional regulator n=1 Tax=Baekduia soli TaxID=496014 RepID=A0A5B8U2Y5_9ACTN|nr:TetR/AcrR family transcriptional regulator [Baekduia soli]QEC47343.1 TetR/AcrR family transcriptional regulator [Baekduia soli]
MSAPKGIRLHRDERREQLVALGLELLGSSPHGQVSIGEIARRAGISKGLLYHYFPTKSDFVVAVLRRSMDELDRRMRPADLGGGPVAILDQSLDGFLGYAHEHAQGFLAVVRARGGADAAIRAVLLEGRRRRVATMVDFAAALAGRPREQLASPGLDLAIEGWLSFCEGVAARWLAEGGADREAVARLLRDVLLAAYASVGVADGREAFAALAEAARSAAGGVSGPALTNT